VPYAAPKPVIGTNISQNYYWLPGGEPSDAAVVWRHVEDCDAAVAAE